MSATGTRRSAISLVLNELRDDGPDHLGGRVSVRLVAPVTWGTELNYADLDHARRTR